MAVNMGSPPQTPDTPATPTAHTAPRIVSASTTNPQPTNLDTLIGLPLKVTIEVSPGATPADIRVTYVVNGQTYELQNSGIYREGLPATPDNRLPTQFMVTALNVLQQKFIVSRTEVVDLEAALFAKSEEVTAVKSQADATSKQLTSLRTQAEGLCHLAEDGTFRAVVGGELYELVTLPDGTTGTYRAGAPRTDENKLPEALLDKFNKLWSQAYDERSEASRAATLANQNTTLAGIIDAKDSHITALQAKLTTAERANAVYAIAVARPRRAYATATRIMNHRATDPQGSTPDENMTTYTLTIRMLTSRIAGAVPTRANALNRAADEFADAFEESRPDCIERAAELVARILDVPQLTVDALGREIYVISALPVALLERTFKDTPAEISRILGDAITRFVPADRHLQVQANHQRLGEIGRVG